MEKPNFWKIFSSVFFTILGIVIILHFTGSNFNYMTYISAVVLAFAISGVTYWVKITKK